MKQRYPSSWGAILASALLISAYLPVSAADPTDSVALLGDKAYVLGEAHAVPLGRGIITDVHWSDYGNAALITRMDLTMSPELLKFVADSRPPVGLTSSIHFWNRKTNQVTEIDRISVANQKFEEVNLLPNERTCFSVVLNTLDDGKQQRQLKIVNPGGGTEFVLAPKDGDIEYAPSTGSSNLLVIVNNGSLESGHIDTQMRIYNADKGRWTPVNITLDTNQVVEYAIYAEHLKSFLIRVLGFGGGKPTVIKFEPETGSTNEITEEALKAELRHTFENQYNRFLHPFSLTSDAMKLPDGRNTHALLLGPDPDSTTPSTAQINRPGNAAAPPPAKADKPLYFGVGVTAFELAPKSDAVLYVVDGLALWREIFAVDRALIESKVDSESKQEIMSRAKQVGLSLIMYASDNDDELPPADGIVDRVMPYLKNEAVFDGFVYTYNGPSNLTTIKDPSTTELGFIRGEGGSAVLYADGHVRWKPDA